MTRAEVLEHATAIVAATELREAGTYGFWHNAGPGSEAARSAFQPGH